MTAVAPAAGSRARILDAALALMADRGVAGTSMRRLAVECGLNVATLYHHFPSKADLLRAVILERGFFERLGSDGPPPAVRRPGPPDARLRRLLRWLWRASLEEEPVWRLLIGESLRGEVAAQETSAALVSSLDVALARWVAEVVPELAGRAGPVARLGRGVLFSLMVEHLATGPDESRAEARFADLAEIAVQSEGST